MERNMSKRELAAEVLSVPEVAAVLKMNVQTAYRLARKGAIPSVRIGGRIVVPRSKLAAMLKGEKIAA
jgi:excisionase family DNA binding protein